MTDCPEPFIETRICDRWTLKLPEHRALRPGWPWWERDALHALWCAIRPGDVVWDIGAEEGDLSALYASWGARVVLVESTARAWPWIRATFEANGLTHFGAVSGLIGKQHNGNIAGNIEGYWPAAVDEEFVPEPGFTMLNEAGETPITTLDALGHWRPDIVVMDIEGAEYQALLGAEKILRVDRPIFAISVHPEFMREQYGDTPDDLLVLMEKADYEARYLSFDHEQHWMFRPR